MLVSKWAIARSVITAAALLAARSARAEDAPVEKPAVERPALPQPAARRPADSSGPTRSSDREEAARGSQVGAGARTRSDPRSADRQRAFLYLAAGPGLLWGASGGRDYERTNAALTGAVGVEVPLSRATGLGFELNGDLELTGE